MKKSRLTAAITLLILISGVPANAQSQTLFGKTYLPYSEERREQAFEDLRKLRIERDRRIFGTSNGMLAEELQMELVPRQRYSSAPGTISGPVISEWFAVYPKIPSGSQRLLARHALYLATEIRGMRTSIYENALVARKSPARVLAGESINSEALVKVRAAKVATDKSLADEDIADKVRSAKIANKMVGCVLTAALAHNWFPYPDLTISLKALADDEHLDQSLRKQALAVLARKPLKIDLKIDSMIIEANKLVESGQAKARIESRKSTCKLGQLSWYPKLLKSIQNPDGSLKEEVAEEPSMELKIAVFPEVESANLASLLSSLTKLYPKLPTESKECFASRLLELTGHLRFSNLQLETDALFEVVFKSIDPTWLEHNAIETQLKIYAPQFQNPPKAEKMLLKVMELQDMFYGGLPSNDNLRWVLGDLYDRMGRYNDSRKQYEIGKEIDERLVRTSILRASDSIERPYKIRNGTYVYSAPVPSKFHSRGGIRLSPRLMK
jgi:tetratricopeptide (TPR) repeat protein